ncbi:MAG: hypothetical protein LBS72_06645 [Oscillospiraceae bacterium]|jgi:hypothetical protein|nr:hypothetical protein [Oscillospiraceae bacterium]
MKRIIILMLAAFFLTGCTSSTPPPDVEATATPAPTESPTAVPTDMPTDIPPTGEPGSQTTPARAVYTGVAESVSDTGISLKETGSDTVTIILTTSAETAFVDIQTAKAAALSDIKAGDVITAVTKPIQTGSMPPQSPALAVFVNPSDDHLPPTYAVATSVEKRDDGSSQINTDADVIWLVNDNTVITAYDGGAAISLDDIKPGAKLIGWYQISTRSLPAQATPDRIVALP